MGCKPSLREHITGTYITRELLDHTRKCNDDILMESETKKTNILTKKHTAGPDSQNCSRSVTGDLSARKKQLWSLENYGASERQRIGVAAFRTGPGVPAGHRPWGFARRRSACVGAGSRVLTSSFPIEMNRSHNSGRRAPPNPKNGGNQTPRYSALGRLALHRETCG